MTPALCVVVNASEAGELAPLLTALRRAGLRLRVAAPAETVAAIEAAGLSVDHALADGDPPAGLRDALAALIDARTPAALLLPPHSRLAGDAFALAAAAGLPAGLLSSAAAGGELALEDFVGAAKREIEEIRPEEALRILGAPQREGWHFVDVREPDEYAAGHIPAAKSSPRGFLEVRADRVHYKRDPWFEDRQRPMILYCGGGHRSALAVATLQRMGFTRLRSLAEGFTGWTERQYPVTPPADDAPVSL